VTPPKTYVVAGSKPWNRRIFREVICKLPGKWDYIGSPEELSLQRLRELAPRYVFFLHWSRKVPQEILHNFECVCFHMTDVPYGRGGSPLQNLIVRGHKHTQLTSLRMTEEFDAGPVYYKEPLSLEGNAEEILIRACDISAKLIQRFVQEEPMPSPQEGDAVVFKRRKPEESEIGTPASLAELYDFIRMLDAEGYPRAFLEYGGFRFEFTRAALYDGRVVADVKITPSEAAEGQPAREKNE
jgi:methionyl-tRNA formyltransferase